MRRLTTRATQGLWLAAVLTLAGCPLFDQFNTPSPQLRIIPAAFEFTDVLTVESFTITNGGAGTLNWQIESVPDWLTITTDTSGSITNQQSSRVVMETNAEGLEDGIFSGFVVVTSNGGRIDVPVVIGVGLVTIQPSISARPDNLSFGRTATEREFEVRNGGIRGGFTFTAETSTPWIDEITPISGDVSTGSPVTVRVVISREGLSDGEYEGTIVLSAPDLEDVEVAVSMEVVSDLPELAVEPTTLDFGSQTTTRTVTVRNTGSGLLSWEVDEDLPWLEVTPASGAVTTQSNTLTVRVNRALQPPGPLEGSFLVRGPEDQEVEVEVLAEVLDATLVVTPTTLNFGTNQTTRIFSISNAGVGTVNWNIDPASLPSWLSLSSTAGSVTTEPESIIATADRAALGPDLFNTTFEVTSNGGNQTITVNLSNLAPELTVTSGLTNSQGQPTTTQAGVPIVDLGTSLNTATFTVANTGTGTLNWEIRSNEIQPWFTLGTIEGSLTEGQSQTVTVTVTREGSFGGDAATLLVRSNAGNRSVVVARTIPRRAVLGIEPDQISLGTTESTAAFLVANFGDPGTNVEYELVTDREWLFVSPDTGTSVGTDTPPPFKDYREHTIFVDRSRLAGSGSVGTVTARAIGVDTGQDPADVPTATLEVAVEATPLSFEQALNRGRVPSIVRFVFTMRDILFETITTPIEAITADAFTILEDGIPLDLTETNVFLTSVSSQYDVNLVVALDYSGSMQVAASRIFDSDNPLQDVYEATIPDFINQIPPRYKVALLAFFDRDQASKIQTPFLRDRAATIAALEGLRDGIGRFGATELIPAYFEAASALNAESGFNVGYDDPDVRAVVTVTDGRGTTPPGDASEFVDNIEEFRARFFNIVWGINQDFAIPGVVSVETGGHFYFTANDFDADLNEIPSTDALAERLSEIINDLENQYILTYITLNESDTASVRVTAAFDPPEDDGTPQDQGIIQGSFEQDIEPISLVGDTRMGQLSMRSDGIRADGSAEIIIRADYVPREIDAFELTVVATEGFFVERVESGIGGIVEDWSLSQAGNTFTLQSPDGTLPYGAFGPMLRLVFPPSAATELEVELAVNNALYASPPANPRFFIAPSIIRVLPGQDALAQAFPTPEIDVDPANPDDIPSTLRIDIPTDTNEVDILIRNTGGVFLGTGVRLNWEISGLPSFVASAEGPNGQTFGTLQGTRDTVTIRVRLNRDVQGGFYDELLDIQYDTGTLGYAGFARIQLVTTVLDPELGVDTPGPGNSIDFGDAFESADIVVSNEGQSTLNWSIDSSALPEWIAVQPTSGQLGAGAATPVTVTIDRDGLAAGAYSTSFVVSGFGQTETVTVEMEVP